MSSRYLEVRYEGNIEDMNPNEKEKVENFINEVEFLTIGTVDKETGVRLSVLSKLKGEGLEELYFATALDTRKIENLRTEPTCEIMFSMDKFTESKGGQVNFTGKMEIFTDLAIKKEKWEDMMSMYFPDGPEDENMCVLQFKTDKVRAMLM